MVSMTTEKGLLVVPRRGKALAFSLLLTAEKYAATLAAQGRGPVQIVSRYTGDVLRVIEREEGT